MAKPVSFEVKMKEKFSTIDQVAKYLAKIHLENEPGLISEVWLFPDQYNIKNSIPSCTCSNKA